MPHHCLDLVDPDEAFDAARFRTAASTALADVAARGRPALVVGGTGLWVRVLLRGLCPAPPRAPRVRAALRALAARCGVDGAAPPSRRASIPLAAARIRPARRGAAGPRARGGLRERPPPVRTGRRRTPSRTRPTTPSSSGSRCPAPSSTHASRRARDDMVAGGLHRRGAPRSERGSATTRPAWASVGYREMRAYVEGACDPRRRRSRPRCSRRGASPSGSAPGSAPSRASCGAIPSPSARGCWRRRARFLPRGERPAA